MEPPDGRIELSRRLVAPVRARAAPALVACGPGGEARPSGGEVYTVCDCGLVVEVLSGTTRHGAITVTRVRVK
ncbi:hypothetical protein ACFYXM_10495 [Streptomyces sp. NPDC002476]|uniref:hypothetical protein n=1 Tax=Streptomyces sp. NPDC002476 TaxID=3364648 RepID=UPI00368459A8